MSKIDELIQKYCPDGVEFLSLKDCTEMLRGTSLTKKNAIAGKYPVISGGREPAFYCDSYNRKGENITIAGSGAGAGFVQYWNQLIFVCDAFSVSGKNDVLTKYVYYCLSAMQDKIYATKTTGGIPHVHISSIENFKIPVPPLPVQQEIVRILDSFTALQDELQKELEERKKQYLFISNTTFGSARMRYVELQEICKIVDCPHSSPKWKSNGIPVIRNYNLVNGRIDTSNLSYVSELDYESRTKRIVPQSGDVLFSREAPIGSLGIIPDNFICCQGQRVVLLRPNKREVNSIYLVHALRSQYVQDQCKKKDIVSSTVGNFGIAELKKLLVPMPLSIKEQLKISDSLETIDQLSFNKNGELAKEILLRQQQYSYYRDKLLNFPRKEA